jgi:hypothetical protein
MPFRWRAVILGRGERRSLTITVSGPIFSGRVPLGKPLFSARSVAFTLVCKIDSGATLIACRNPDETDRLSPSLMTCKYPNDGADVNFCTSFVRQVPRVILEPESGPGLVACLPHRPCVQNTLFRTTPAERVRNPQSFRPLSQGVRGPNFCAFLIECPWGRRC